MLAIRLDQGIEDRLAALARRTGRTKTYYAREAILAHLDHLEEAYLAAPPRASGRPSFPPAAERNQRIVRRSLHAPDLRTSSWLDRTPVERLAALEAIRQTSPDFPHAEPTFPRFSRVTRQAQG